MEVLLLGTGSADGWPNPFCDCKSCAAMRSQGQTRGQTAALVDDVLLLDCGPEAPRSAARAGRRLGGVRHLLLTHDHPDHLGPIALLWRSWAGARAPLTVWGPASAVEACAAWIGPDDPVTLRPLAPGDEVGLVTDRGHYRVLALAATHPRDALLYRVTGPLGEALLLATDTGPLPQPTVDALRGTPLGLLLVEETFGDADGGPSDHLDLASLPRELDRLRAVGAIDERIDVVAVHLGHHNPAPPDLDRRLARVGARAVPDLTVLTVSGGAADGAPARAARRTLLVGGARSGKSTEAERRCAGDPDVVYVATAPARPDDAEWVGRLEAHRARRPAGWATVETAGDPTALARLVAEARPGRTLLVDCLSLWLADALDIAGAWPAGDAQAGDDVADVDPAAVALVEKLAEDLTAALRATRARVVLVTNEVGSGVVPATTSGRVYRDLLGRLNTAVAAACDEVVLVVAGRLLPLTDPTGAAPDVARRAP
ncbi:MAG: bifunctional adenosylcobinamide kinase/adenosylcobinamide-phosphate guanylyltransferase [Candidatus Nanopelagicales bacterium]